MKASRNRSISAGILIAFCFGEFIKYTFINWEKYLGSSTIFQLWIIMICIDIHICSYINNCYLSLKKKKRKFRQKIFYPFLQKLFLIKYFGMIYDTELQYSAF